MSTIGIIITAFFCIAALIVFAGWFFTGIGNKGEATMISASLNDPDVQTKDINDFIEITRLKIEWPTRDEDFMFLPDMLRKYENFRNERHKITA